MAARFNHISIPSSDLDESVGFYVDVFGLREIPAPLFGGLPVRWLQAGEQQLHLFRSDDGAHREQHFAFDVDDFEAFYWKVRERGITDDETFDAHLRRHPAGWLQLYLRDPSGNLIEVNWPDADALSAELLAESVDLDAIVPQEGAAATATLYTGADA